MGFFDRQGKKIEHREIYDAFLTKSIEKSLIPACREGISHKVLFIVFPLLNKLKK